jgi:hypothetical protein
MILTVLVLLAVIAFILTIANAMYPPRVPLWIAVLILSVMALLQVLPLK